MSHTFSAHKSVKCVETELYIDTWSETHTKEGHIVETFEGKVKMKNVI